MPRVFVLLGVVLFVAATARTVAAQPASPPPPDWKQWAPLIGEWEADTPTTNAPTGSFVLAPELQGRVLVRRNHAEYPKTAERPASTHEDLMVVHRDGDVTRAEYWDNEGHVIRYVATVDKAKASFTFASEANPNQPRFRLTYALTGPKSLSLRFEVAAPDAPDRFRPYIEATMHRKR
jgi:hypothetical protein